MGVGSLDVKPLGYWDNKGVPDKELYAQELETFLEAMRYKLAKNKHKGHWEGIDIDDLLRLLDEEVQELKQAIEGENEFAIILEAADVANFAMMIAWNCLHKLK